MTDTNTQQKQTKDLLQEVIQKGPLTIIFVGVALSSKDAHAQMLTKEIKEVSKRNVICIETGNLIQNYLPGLPHWLRERFEEVFISRQALPHAFSIMIWMQQIAENMSKKDDHLIFCGSPMSKQEGEAMHDFLKFINRKAIVVHFSMNLEKISENMKNKSSGQNGKEKDDSVSQRKLDEYNQKVVPAINALSIAGHKIIQIPEEIPEEKVHWRIVREVTRFHPV